MNVIQAITLYAQIYINVKYLDQTNRDFQKMTLNFFQCWKVLNSKVLMMEGNVTKN